MQKQPTSTRTPEPVVIPYKPTPTMRIFHASDEPLRGVSGPISSGKSVGCCIELFGRACAQLAYKGVRRSRFALIRNSYPDLLGTTMKTWKAWFPASICQIKMSPPIEGLLRLPLPDGTELAMELVFLAVEKEDDVKRLLSLELTGGYVNEAREVDKAVIDMLIGRTGRYPAVKDGGFTWSGVIMDTNAPDDESWWYNWAEVEKPDGYRFFRQPPAVIPIQKTPESAITWVPNIGTDPRWPQAAENVENLGEKWQYYMKQIPGKSVDWIKSYLMGEYATVCYGRPVYGEYMDSVHYAGGPLNIYAGIPLILGWDYGLTPTCVIAQLSPQGQLRLIEEFCGQDCGVEQFVTQIVKPALKNGYPGMRLLSTGDPAGNSRAQSTETTCMQILAQAGIPTTPCPTNEFVARREAVASFMRRMIGREPGFLVSSKCPTLRKGFQGRYYFKRLTTSREVMFKGEVEKNMYSHPQDAVQYIAYMASNPQAAFSARTEINTPQGVGAYPSAMRSGEGVRFSMEGFS